MLIYMDYFLVFDREQLPDRGLEAFGAGHFGWLAFAALLCIVLCRACRRASLTRRRALRYAVASLILTSELTRQLCLFMADTPFLQTLPLHLCSLSVYLAALYSLHPTPLAGELLYSLTLPGAAFALLFPDWLYYPAGNLLSISAFSGIR